MTITLAILAVIALFAWILTQAIRDATAVRIVWIVAAILAALVLLGVWRT